MDPRTHPARLTGRRRGLPDPAARVYEQTRHSCGPIPDFRRDLCELGHSGGGDAAASPGTRTALNTFRSFMTPPPLPPIAPETTLRGLVSRVAACDQEALQNLHRMTGDRLHRVALKILRNWQAAEEVVSETFTQVWRTADTFDPDRGSVQAWLSTIVRSRALDRLRGRSPGAASIDEMGSSMHPPGHDGSPSQVAVGSEDASNIRRAVRGLPSTQRQVIELSFFRGLSHAQIAATLDQPLGTVKTRIRSGICAIRESLSD